MCVSGKKKAETMTRETALCLDDVLRWINVSENGRELLEVGRKAYVRMRSLRNRNSQTMMMLLKVGDEVEFTAKRGNDSGSRYTATVVKKKKLKVDVTIRHAPEDALFKSGDHVSVPVGMLHLI